MRLCLAWLDGDDMTGGESCWPSLTPLACGKSSSENGVGVRGSSGLTPLLQVIPLSRSISVRETGASWDARAGCGETRRWGLIGETAPNREGRDGTDESTCRLLEGTGWLGWAQTLGNLCKGKDGVLDEVQVWRFRRVCFYRLRLQGIESSCARLARSLATKCQQFCDCYKACYC